MIITLKVNGNLQDDCTIQPMKDLDFLLIRLKTRLKLQFLSIILTQKTIKLFNLTVSIVSAVPDLP